MEYAAAATVPHHPCAWLMDGVTCKWDKTTIKRQSKEIDFLNPRMKMFIRHSPPPPPAMEPFWSTYTVDSVHQKTTMCCLLIIVVSLAGWLCNKISGRVDISRRTVGRMDGRTNTQKSPEFLEIRYLVHGEEQREKRWVLPIYTRYGTFWDKDVPTWPP